MKRTETPASPAASAAGSARARGSVTVATLLPAVLFALVILVPALARPPVAHADTRGADPAANPTVAASPAASPTAAPEPAGFAMDARALLQGHARPGAWMAISVNLSNDGPPIVGELRMVGGPQGTTRFSVPVDLPTTSRKSYSMYVQAPVFGSKVDVALIVGDASVARRQVAFALHDLSQLSVGVVAERSGDLVASIGRVNDPTAPRPAVFGLSPADLPARAEAWAPIDRLVWQDVDASQLTREQLAALRTWVAGGGRLTIVGGTNGANVLGGFPDELLPYRPATTLDVEPAQIRALVGGSLPSGATPVAALAGTLRDGRAIASSGDQAIVAEMGYGTGGVAIVGFDPTQSWLGGTDRADAVWQRVIPGRAGATGQILVGDDSPFVSLLQMIPSLALPSIEGLLLLLLGYIILVGPINYLVLRRLDRREWAWISVPLIVAGSTVAAFAIGNTLRGSDVIVNQVAVVRGAPGTDAAQAQVFLGIFSPSRTAYDVSIGNGALVTGPVSDFSGTGSAGNLDVVQADPATVRGLNVGYGSMRTIRADAAVTAPRIAVSLVSHDGRLEGSVRNDSTITLHKPVVILGMTVARLDDLAPGASATISQPIQTGTLGSSLSERVFGAFNGFDGTVTSDYVREQVRRQLVDALTYDPFTGWSGTLPTAGPVLLAWGDPGVLTVTVRDSKPVTTGETLYYVPLEFGMQGHVSFTPDLIRVSIVDNKAQMFQKDPTFIGMGQGSVVLAYRPVAIQGNLTQPQLILAVNTGDPYTIPEPSKTITADAPLAASPAPSGSPGPSGSASPAPAGSPVPTAIPTPSSSPAPSGSPVPAGSPTPSGPLPPDGSPAALASPTPSPVATPPVAPDPTPAPTAQPTDGVSAPGGGGTGPVIVVPAPPVPVAGPGSGLPTVEIYDLVLGAWRGLSQLPQSGTVAVAEADHFVDADSGTVLIRLSSNDPNSSGLQFSMKIAGVIR